MAVLNLTELRKLRSFFSALDTFRKNPTAQFANPLIEGVRIPVNKAEALNLLRSKFSSLSGAEFKDDNALINYLSNPKNQDRILSKLPKTQWDELSKSIASGTETTGTSGNQPLPQTATGESAATMAGGNPTVPSVPGRPPMIPNIPQVPAGVANLGKNVQSSTSIFLKRGGSSLFKGLGGLVGAGGRGLGSFGLKAVNGGLDRAQAISRNAHSIRSSFRGSPLQGKTGLKFALALIGGMFLLGALAMSGTSPTGEAAPTTDSVGIGSSAPVTAATSSSQYSCATSMSVENINDFFDQKGYYNFQGTGQTFSDAAQKYKINPALIIAIGIQESALGNVYKGTAENSKNAFGLMQKGSVLMNFSSWAEGAKEAFKIINGYNCPTVECIGQKYAPIGADNDPYNLNQNWVPGINNNLKSIPQSSCGPLFAGGPDDLPSGWPATGVITQGPFHTGGTHNTLNAVDIANPGKDIPVYSTLNGIAGEVVSTDITGGGYGVYVIIINEQTKAEVLFGHLVPGSNSHLTKGQKISKGDRIGTMDSTGYSTGSHVHYEIRGSIQSESFSQFIPGGIISNGTIIKQAGNPTSSP